MSHLPSEAVAEMARRILDDPEFVLEIARRAGLPTMADLAAEAQARAQMEQGQENRLTALENALSGKLVKASNLSDLPDKAAARSNLAFPDATTTAKGLMSSADKTKLNSLGIAAQAMGTATTPAVTLIAPVDVVVTLSAPMPDTNYSIFPFVEGGVVGKLTPTIKSKTTTTVTVTLTAAIAVTLGAGAVTVIAWKSV